MWSLVQALIQNASVFIEKGILDMDTHTGSTPCANGSRDQGAAPIGPSVLKIVGSKLPEAMGQAGNAFSSWALEADDSWISHFQPPELRQ